MTAAGVPEALEIEQSHPIGALGSSSARTVTTVTSSRKTVQIAVALVACIASLVLLVQLGGTFLFPASGITRHSPSVTPEETSFLKTWPTTSGLAYAPTCEPFPNKAVILVTVSVEYMVFFRNWLHYAELTLRDDAVQIVVAAEDDAVAQELQHVESSLSFAVLGHSGSLTRKDAVQLWDFGTPEYSALVGKRPTRVMHFLSRGCSVLYADIDAVWIRPVLPEIANLGVHSLYLTDDSRGNLGFTEWYLCSCLLYMHPTDAIKQLVTDWGLYIVHYDVLDQIALNAVLKADFQGDRQVSFGVLPYSKFPPGCAAKANNQTAVVLHANWRVGIPAKEDFFKNFASWSLPSASHVM